MRSAGRAQAIAARPRAAHPRRRARAPASGCPPCVRWPPSRVDPGTAAAAYRLLRERGFVISDGRRGTRVAAQLEPRPPRASRSRPASATLRPASSTPCSCPMSAARSSAWPRAAPTSLATRRTRSSTPSRRTPAGSSAAPASTRTALELRRRHPRRTRARAAGAPAARRSRRGRGSRVPATARPAAGAEPPGGADRDRRRGPRSRSARARPGARPRRAVVTPHGQNPFGASLSEERAATLRRMLGRASCC